MLNAQIGAGNAESFIINNAYLKMTMSYAGLKEGNDVADAFPEGVTTNALKALLYIYKDGCVASSDLSEWSG
jgi:hypothetical protein